MNAMARTDIQIGKIALRTGSLTLRRVACSTTVALIAVMVQVVPDAAELLQFDRSAIAEGQWWRLLTGHLTHWSLNHLFWDVLMFVVLGCLVEIQSRRRMIGLCLGSAIVISGVIWIGSPDLETYRGLSGIDTALFVSVAISIAVTAVAQRQWARALTSGLLMVGLTGKLLFETVTGSTLFVDSNASGFLVLVEAHLSGVVVAAITFCFGQRQTR
jgi:rhomboid family GlyGly-CTERM serine protease